MAEEHDQPTVALPGGGAMPMVGFGTWQLTGGRAYEAVRHALGVGYRHIDTATIYGNEQEVGRALHDSGVPRLPQKPAALFQNRRSRDCCFNSFASPGSCRKVSIFLATQLDSFAMAARRKYSFGPVDRKSAPCPV